MRKGKYVFSQLLDFLDCNDFNYLSRKHGGDKYVKPFTCYNQLCVLMFGQLSNHESLRDVVLATQSHASKAYHLGFGKHAAKSTRYKSNGCHSIMKRTRSTSSTEVTTTSNVFITLKSLEPTSSSEERPTMTSNR